MRKTIVIIVTVVGMTLLIMLGYIAPATEQINLPGAVFPEQNPGRAVSSVLPNAEIRAIVDVSGDTFADMKRMISQFERLHSNIRVELVKAGETGAAAGKSGEADIMLIHVADVRKEAARGRLLALDDLLPADEPSRWFGALHDAVRWNDFLWGIPVDWDPYVVVFGGDSGPPAAASARSGEEMPAAGAAAEAAVKSVLQGETDWAVVRFSDAVRYGQPPSPQDEPLLSVAPVAVGKDGAQDETDGQAEDQGEAVSERVPFAGSSFVISPGAQFPAEAAEWALYMLEPEVYREWKFGESDGWPARRSMYRIQPPPVVAPPPLSAGSLQSLAVPRPNADGSWRLGSDTVYLLDSIVAAEWE